MACTQARTLALGELAGGRLDGAALEELLDHVQVCPPCSAELDDVAGVVAALEAAPALPAVADWSRALGLLGAAAALIFALVLARTEGGFAGSLAALGDTTPLAVQPGALRSDGERDPLDAALEPYRRERWRTAARALAALRASGDDRALVAFYLGVARLQVDARSALPPLEVAAEHGQGLLGERALWYSAQAHLVLRDEAAARAALRALVARAGDYELNARDLLDALDAR